MRRAGDVVRVAGNVSHVTGMIPKRMKREIRFLFTSPSAIVTGSPVSSSNLLVVKVVELVI
jgi:hypothetical protein